MSAPRVLVVESLDAAGSDRSDLRGRCAALRARHAVVRGVTLVHRHDGPSPPVDAAIHASSTVAEWDTSPEGLTRLRAFAREGRFDLILIASAIPGGGPGARATAIGVPAWWWPTGLARSPGWGARLGLGRGASLPPLGHNGSRSEAGPPAGLSWSSAGERHAGRGRLTLWDGDYLLAPLPLDGEAGSRLLAAFADHSALASELDLVVLSEPQPGFEREARARGIGTRVHFVGPAPREAEWAWWAHASGAVLAGSGPVSGGLVLRGLVTGCPLVVAAREGPCATIGRWLAGHGCSPWLSAGGEDLAGTLARMLEREARASDAVARGRALAAQHDHDRLVSRLAAALPILVGEGAARRAAVA